MNRPTRPIRHVDRASRYVVDGGRTIVAKRCKRRNVSKLTTSSWAYSRPSNFAATRWARLANSRAMPNLPRPSKTPIGSGRFSDLNADAEMLAR
jgi:hypothetical protein